MLMADVASKSAEIAFKQATIDKLTHEMAVLKRLKFAAKSEAFNAEQKSLLEETIDTDLAALAAEIEQRAPSKDPGDKQQPKRAVLPAYLPRREIHHEPENTTCGCGCQMKRIGEDVAEKLDYAPGVFTVERHVRGKWVCAKCETLVQAPVAPHIIDKGIPTTGLLAQVLVAKYQDHLPLYRQEHIFGRAGLAIPRSTLATWVGQCGVQLQPLVDALKAVMLKSAVLHADETPVAMLKPGNEQDAPGLHLDLLHHYLRRPQGGGVRLRRGPRRAARAQLPGPGRQCRQGRLARQARVRRLLGLQRLLRAGRDRGRMSGPCPAQVPRAVGQPRQPGGRAGAEVLRRAVRHRA